MTMSKEYNEEHKTYRINHNASRYEESPKAVGCRWILGSSDSTSKYFGNHMNYWGYTDPRQVCGINRGVKRSCKAAGTSILGTTKSISRHLVNTRASEKEGTDNEDG